MVGGETDTIILLKRLLDRPMNMHGKDGYGPCEVRRE